MHDVSDACHVVHVDVVFGGKNTECSYDGENAHVGAELCMLMCMDVCVCSVCVCACAHVHACIRCIADVSLASAQHVCSTLHACHA